MASSLSVIRGSPGETIEQLAARLTRQSDAWASIINAAMKTIEKQAAQIRELEDRVYRLEHP